MTAEDIYEVITKLIGPIEPIADSAVDSIREDNLHKFIEVFHKMHMDIDNIAYTYSESSFASAEKLGKMASRQLDDMGIKNCTCQ